MAIKSDSIKVTPSGYDSTNYSYASVVSGYPLTNPVGKDSTSTSMCRINLKTGSGAESYVFYTFDFSAIPSDATIKSVSGKVKAYINQTNIFRIETRLLLAFTVSDNELILSDTVFTECLML